MRYRLQLIAIALLTSQLVVSCTKSDKKPNILFNVKSYKNDDRILITLEEGEVIISSSERFRLAENIVLTRENRQGEVKRQTYSYLFRKI